MKQKYIVIFIISFTFAFTLIYILFFTNNIISSFSTYKPPKISDNKISEITISKEVKQPNINNPIQKTIYETHKYLVNKYDIKATDEEILVYIKKKHKSLSEEEFEKIRLQMDVLLTAVTAIVEDGISPNKAKQIYIDPVSPNLGKSFLPTLQKADIQMLERLRKNTVNTKDELFHKWIDAYRDIVEMIKIADIIFKVDMQDLNSHTLDIKYKKMLLEFAKENLVGTYPNLKGIDPDEIDPNIFNIQIVPTDKENKSVSSFRKMSSD